MKTSTLAGEYRSPKTKVIEVQVENLICLSKGDAGGTGSDFEEIEE